MVIKPNAQIEVEYDKSDGSEKSKKEYISYDANHGLVYI